ncbi:BnaC01g15020D [Brassica napus]|uniref:BnaC01g15020D protein n=1 Tax=Brassica napus TaxID=3708 RepID=A0A078FD36_BRANA|nr:BnaC01g15020D [Brassica napus]
MIFTSCLALAVDEFPSWIEKNFLQTSKYIRRVIKGYCYEILP